MAVKFNQYWTVNHDRTSDYSKFVVKEYIPEMNKLGIHIVAGWTVLVGGYSEICLEGITNNLELLEHALRHNNFEKMRTSLYGYVTNYKTKVLTSTERHDFYSSNVTENIVKLIQAWDVRSNRESDYDNFVRKNFYPMLENLSIQVANEWRVLIGDGPSIICEGRVEKINTLIQNLKTKTFQKTRAMLKKLITNYESRILTVHVCKDLGYKSVYYSVISV